MLQDTRITRTLNDYYNVCGDVGLGYDGDLQIPITDIACDSEQVTPGSIFIAVNGLTYDGRSFIPDALRRGAAAVVYKADDKIDLPVPSFRVSGDYAAVGKIAEYHYGYPASDMTLIATTGTDGKTTTAYLLYSILRQSGRKVGLIGSVEYKTGDRSMPAERTTPTPISMQRLISEMKHNGVECLVVEVSSHGLSQQRLGTMQFDVAIFTNLTEEHLDYHGSMDNYYNAKRRLFVRHLKPDGKRVINIDDPFGRLLAGARDVDADDPHSELGDDCQSRITYGFDSLADYHPSAITMTIDRTESILNTPTGPIDVGYSLIGRFNAYNTMAAISTAVALGTPITQIQNALREFKGPPGRLQRVPDSEGVHVFVDFAHTDHALENVLHALRPLTNDRVIVIFGCGGDRDKSKRPRMGRVASELADLVVVTTDNPRTENPKDIINDVLSGVPEDTKHYVLPDRHAAIFFGINSARPGDVVLVAGKGHEQYQEVDGEKTRFCDIETCREALSARTTAAAPAERVLAPA